jgi:hypothetical protein
MSTAAERSQRQLGIKSIERPSSLLMGAENFWPHTLHDKCPNMFALSLHVSFVSADTASSGHLDRDSLVMVAEEAFERGS